MDRIWKSAILSVLLLSASNLLAAAPAADMASLVESNNEFAVDLYHQFATNNEGNLCFSPYGINISLAMVYLGARGETAQQMKRVLHLNLPDNRLRDSFRLMMDGLKTGNEMSGRSDCELTIANSIWCQSGYPFNHSFLELMRDNFRAELFQLDFANGDERARNEINSWADKKTHGHLKALIGQGVLDGNTRLVLVNAIHFKAAWGMPFDKRMTKTEPFYAGGEQGVAAPFMCSDDNIEAGLESDDLQLLELPYSDPKLVIDILLPKNRTGLKPLEERLSAANMNKWFSELEEYSPQIELPRLKLAGLVNLHSALAAMGIRDLFDPGRADLSGISSAHKLYASHLAQGAYVAIDENGTEADATTAVEIKMLTRGRPMQFKADHPFVFAIRNRATGAILLLGRLVNPAE